MKFPGKFHLPGIAGRVQVIVHATEMGKFAGYNAARGLLGLPLRPYRRPDYHTCLDLGRSGAVFTSGWDRQVQSSGDEVKHQKRQINTQWNYPPVWTREEILASVHIDAQLAETQEPSTDLVA